MSPPECTDALLALLRSKRLLDDEALARLGAAWDGNDDPGPHVDELIEAGLLTPFQAGHIRAGRVGRLRLGPYRLVERLGRAVYRAEHTLLGRTVVLKVLGRRGRRVGSSSDRSEVPAVTRVSGSSRSSSRREILAAGTLDHPHVVAAHDARWIRGRLVLVLEHVEGIDLSRLLAQTGPLPIGLVRRIARQTASALDHLHRRGLVHRDVKPANLLLSHGTGPEAVVKLLDLGLVCPAKTGGEELCGTPDYMPPERGHSPDAIDIRGDLYSLGCTLYELLAGRVPFPGGNWTGKLLRHRLEVPTPIAELRREVPADLADLVARLMAREPEGRPGSPAEVVRMLEGERRALLSTPSRAGRGAAESIASPPGRSSPRSRGESRARFLYPLAVVVGVLVGFACKFLPPAGLPAASLTSAPPAATLDLEAAIASAADGATIEVPEGEYRIAPIRVEGRSLTLRAAPGARPRLRPAGMGRRWDALLSCDRNLGLAGIDLAGEEDALAPLVVVEGCRLSLEDCKLSQHGGTPAVSLRRGVGVEVRACEIRAASQAVAVELGAQTCAIKIEHSRIEARDPVGPALLLWCPDPDPSARAEVRLGDCDIRSGRVVACSRVGGAVLVEAGRNRLSFRQALVSLDECGGGGEWRRVLSYAGRDNRHEAAGAWLRLEGRPAAVWTEKAWAALWTDPRVATPRGGEFVPDRRGSSLQFGVRR